MRVKICVGIKELMAYNTWMWFTTLVASKFRHPSLAKLWHLIFAPTFSFYFQSCQLGKQTHSAFPVKISLAILTFFISFIQISWVLTKFSTNLVISILSALLMIFQLLESQLGLCVISLVEPAWAMLDPFIVESVYNGQSCILLVSYI